MLTAWLHRKRPSPFRASEQPTTILRQCPTAGCFQTIAWTRQKDGAWRASRCFTCGAH